MADRYALVMADKNAHTHADTHTSSSNNNDKEARANRKEKNGGGELKLFSWVLARARHTIVLTRENQRSTLGRLLAWAEGHYRTAVE